MGYDLHITRKSCWNDPAGPTISPEEWLAVLADDPELSRATDASEDALAGAWKGRMLFWFSDGEVTCKNPDKPTIGKMAQIARRLNATVQGDDGEIYQDDGSVTEAEPTVSATPNLISRIKAWFKHRQTGRQLRAGVPAFKVGQRVKAPLGVHGTIIHVDPSDNGGLGCVRIRTDDGGEHEFAYIASGLKVLAD